MWLTKTLTAKDHASLSLYKSCRYLFMVLGGGCEYLVPGQGCATPGTSRAWEDHAQEGHVKGTVLNSGQCESGT